MATGAASNTANRGMTLPVKLKLIDEDSYAHEGKIDFVDISSPDYSAADNAGISYATAMERIHAIERDGTVVTGVAVFRRLSEAVGLGWVYAATKNKAVETAANAVYEVWAKYRTQLTGREAL